MPTAAPNELVDKPITKWCHHYFSKSGCERGHLCTFAHDASQLGKRYLDRPRYAGTHKMVLCRYFAAGQPCAASCPFAHGAAELGIPKTCGAKSGAGPWQEIPRAKDSEWEAYRWNNNRWWWGWAGGWASEEWTKTPAAQPESAKRTETPAAQPESAKRTVSAPPGFEPRPAAKSTPAATPPVPPPAQPTESGWVVVADPPDTGKNAEDAGNDADAAEAAGKNTADADNAEASSQQGGSAKTRAPSRCNKIRNSISSSPTQP